jgi:hypothetical protein
MLTLKGTEMAVKYEVCIIESEAGWGQKREYEYFDTVEEAIKRRDKINSYNKPGPAPSWYMIAVKEIRVVEK